MIAGNGTIGLELAEQLPDADAVLVPWGGGGLFTGIATALAAVCPGTPVFAVQPETGAAVSAALAAGKPSEAPGFAVLVRGRRRRQGRPAADVGARAAAAGRRGGGLARRHRRGRAPARGAGAGDRRGAGALALAAALSGRIPGRKLVCIVSGGNIDADRLSAILRGETPD